MINIKNEREVLPIIRSPLSNWKVMTEVFIPIIISFYESNKTFDEYQGYAFGFTILKKDSEQYQNVITQIDLSKEKIKENWYFYPTKTNRNESIWIYKDILLLFHIESWLWFE